MAKTSTAAEIEAIKSDLAELRARDEKEDQDIEHLKTSFEDFKRTIGSDEDARDLRKNAEKGKIAYSILVWAGGVIGSALLLALAYWILSGGLSNKADPDKAFDAISAPAGK